MESASIVNLPHNPDSEEHEDEKKSDKSSHRGEDNWLDLGGSLDLLHVSCMAGKREE